MGTWYYEIHNIKGHGVGKNAVVNKLRKRFWIIVIKETVNEIESFGCWIEKANPNNHMMLQVNKPPRAFLTKQGCRRRPNKWYVSVITCLQIRAFHPKDVHLLDTDGFLIVFSTKSSRRGVPVHIVSDRRSNFIGYNWEIKTLVD